jgi:putative aldouronate transport system permease protein
MVITVCGAYALTKKRMPGVKIFIGLVIFQMLFHGGIVPTYLTMKNYHLLDLPISMPTLAAITLFYAVDRWNEWWNRGMGRL